MGRKAFTLMELLVVVAILGITTAFAIGGVAKVKTKNDFRVMELNLRSLHGQMQIYKAKTGSYDDFPENNYHFNVPDADLSFVNGGAMSNLNGNACLMLFDQPLSDSNPTCLPDATYSQLLSSISAGANYRNNQ